MKRLLEGLLTPYKSVFALYLFVISVYLIDPSSRRALGEANSSFLGDNLQAKIILILAGFLLSAYLVFILSYSNFLVNLTSLFSRESTYYIPLVLFLLFNALPALVQNFVNLSIINSYYRILQVGNTFPNFIDLKQTIGFLLNSEINQIGDQGLIYPKIILELRFLNSFIDSRHAALLISFASILLVAAMIWDFAHRLTLEQNFFLSLLVISPPFLLLIDRQNIDIFILVTLYLAARIYGKSEAFSIVAIFLVAVTALMKIYPIMIIFYFIIFGSSKKVKGVALGLFTICLSIILPDLSAIQRFQVTDMAGSAGVPVLMAHLYGGTKSGFVLSLAFLFLMVGSFILIKHFRSRSIFQAILDDCNFLLVVFGSVVLTTTLLTSTNYLYRYVFLIFIVPFFGKFKKDSLFNVAFIFLFLGMYLSPRSTGVLFNIYMFPFVLVLLFGLFQFLLFNITSRKNNMSKKTNN
jgi:hypothetical protein